MIIKLEQGTMKKNLTIFTILFCLISGFLFSVDIHKAVEEKNLDKVKLILKDHPDLLNKANEHGRTPLNIACRMNDMKTVRYLLHHGQILTRLIKVNIPHFL
jgi:hypothetical protein